MRQTLKLIEVSVDETVALKLKEAGWHFDWDISFGAVSQKVAAFALENIQGIVEFEEIPLSSYNMIYRIELAPENIGRERQFENVAGTLFAYVAQDSLKAGFDGFVVFDSKTVLAQHYIERYGAKILYGNRLYFDTKASKKLIKQYLENGDET